MQLVDRIQQWDKIRLSPAWHFVPQACNELDVNGFVEHNHAEYPHPHDAVLIAFKKDGLLLGFISYRLDDRWNNWWVSLAWVNEQYRNKGVHTRLFESLVERARVRGDITSIESGTHKDNVAAQKAFERQGRNLVVLGYSFPIRQYLSGKHYLDVEESDE